MAEARLVFELALVHYIPTTVYNTGPVGTQFNCADRCFYNETCVSMIHDMGTRDCYFYKIRATLAESVGYPLDSSIIMFNTKRDPCPDSEGYTWDETLAVCYKYHSTDTNHATAVDTCTGEGARGLLRVDTGQKKEFFVSLYPSSYIWLDGSKVDGQWVFSNGEALVSELWNLNEPSGDGACLQFRDLGLNDAPCSSLHAFICEIHV